MDIPKKEQEILDYWDQINAFQKSVEGRPADRRFVFYDGPPFATGLPHYGNLLPGTIKDVIPRYKTMRGYRVERRWGWDCHGLPVENLLEKELGIKDRKAIEQFGVAKFNEACRASVTRYVDEWKNIIRRTGRWVDMNNAYFTMDRAYMESIWWVFGELYKKGLLYEGRKPMHICPRCETPLSNFEVALGYKDITDPAITVRFRLKDLPESVVLPANKPVYLIAWTTTPWTLPGNMFLAAHPAHDYAAVDAGHEVVIVARARFDAYFGGEHGTQLHPYIKGIELEGLRYEPLFPYFKDRAGAFRVVMADFVTLDDGTGIVHIAPAFGEDDLAIGEREKVDIIQHVGMDGKLKDEVTDFRGRFVKSADKDIVAWLKEQGHLFEENTITHSYPHCWRCDAPLLNYATSSWFVNVTALKEKLLAHNQEINWIPEHMRDGRFGKWLEGARDWSISRNRFWGTPLPVWKAPDGDVLVVSSCAELGELSGKKIDDLHKHIVDAVEIQKDGKTYTRISDVLDCWFESGTMPYGEVHYPFENKKDFDEHFPADFIAEGQDQTRGWFYTLHVLATALFDRPAYKNVVVNGMVMAEDGKKMAKRLKNYPEVTEVLDKYGADALRFYLMNSPVVRAENLNFSEKGVDEVYKKVILIVENVVAFWEMYSDVMLERGPGPSDSISSGSYRPASRDSRMTSDHILDRWISARTHELIRDVTNAYEAYDLQGATRPVVDFVNDLSTWFVRRSRERFKANVVANVIASPAGAKQSNDRQNAIATLRYVLFEFSKVIAPVMPFLAERMYQVVTRHSEGRSPEESRQDASMRTGSFASAQDDNQAKESVHLENWPAVQENLIDQKLLDTMQTARKIVELGLAARMEAAVKIRQPLSEFRITGAVLEEEFLALVRDELNVQVVSNDAAPLHAPWIMKQEGNIIVSLNTEMTEELRELGTVREMVRRINDARKTAGLSIQDIVPIYIDASERVRAIVEKHRDTLTRQTLAREIVLERPDGMTGAEVEVDGETVWIGVGKLKDGLEYKKEKAPPEDRT
ncbi:hypothetical protein A3H75_02075 [Candidatus Uhrbacteria bacterium RIFCSPLOWO2_02_FULL_51_9]|uniref:Isoleucine--tRNA ligase n=1 Tax=Candidatus Uhrbacteria bacterium RIFCSPLOWO2_02_FULL_51_9 TaxID=1802410 RepID=A0A1F7VEG1_9BACT|nr:MAG: hypothetical protein A3H75_02075 [Candidatus Uhrbacteria bacterium RIFCSPLOWO2_02_FULL_51_9]